MAGLTRLTLCLLLATLVSGTSAGTRKVLLWAAARSPDDPTAETLSLIDANQDGQIDRGEVSAFAQTEGLDIASATDDFSAVDTNGDGTLDPSELIQVVGNGAPGSAAAAQPVTSPAKVSPPSSAKPPASAKTATVAVPHMVATRAASTVSVPHVVKGLAAQKPPVTSMDKHGFEPHIDMQAKTNPALRPKKLKAVPQAIDGAKKSIQAAQPLQAVDGAKEIAEAAKLSQAMDAVKKTIEPATLPQAMGGQKKTDETTRSTPVEPVVKHFAQVDSAAQVVEAAEKITEAAKPTPVDRMVKHFAQVLRTAEIVPVQAQTLKPAVTSTVADPVEAEMHKSAATALKVSSAVATEARVSVQSAAKEVSEQLSIAEAAEAKARVLDRRAAEELANATVLAKLTTQEALNAGAAAAHSKANELLSRIAKLEDQAERAQVRSAALHSKAKLETDEASELMAVADRALNRSPKGGDLEYVQTMST